MRKGEGKYFLPLIVGMIAGFLLGVLGINTLISARVDEYHEKISYLEKVIAEDEAKLQKLVESINKRKFILKDVEVILICEGDNLERIALEKHIKEKYSKLLGKEVKNIDMDMAVDIVDGRIMKIEEKEYKLKVDKLLLTDVLRIWVKISV